MKYSRILSSLLPAGRDGLLLVGSNQFVSFLLSLLTDLFDALEFLWLGQRGVLADAGDLRMGLALQGLVFFKHGFGHARLLPARCLAYMRCC